MKVLVTGVCGQLGFDVMNELAARGIEGVGSDHSEMFRSNGEGFAIAAMPYVKMDITDEEEVRGVMARVKPDAVIHCAAWTAVDLAEEQPEKCRRVNALGTELIARECGRYGIPMMYFSTDYVFDGTGTRPWKPDDRRCPVDVYGATKAEGEDAVMRHAGKYFILRISWVFGLNGKNFIRTMLRLAGTHRELRVVSDQIGNPTCTADLAVLVADMIVTDKYGIYHVTNEGEPVSWCGFAEAVFEEAGIGDVRVIPVTTEDYGAPAPRPKNSRMDRSLLTERGFKLLPSWRDALRRYIRLLRDRGEL